ncbi:MAG TPA: hypothetical protein VGC72_16820 [Candidatus Elarobacter sp.]|jgi:hypothetical protein
MMMDRVNAPRWVRSISFALYGAGVVAAVLMAAFSAADARLPWMIVALFSAGSFFETMRNRPPFVS